MSNTVRTEADLLALFPDNITGLITAQAGRDLIVSTFGWADSGPPGPNNDNVDTAGIGAKFDTGSRWVDILNDHAWFCIAGSPGAAVWERACCNSFPLGIVVGLTNPALEGIQMVGALGQSANLIDISDNARNPLLNMLPTGSIILRPNNDVALIRKRLSELLTNDTDQWQDDTGAVLASINHLGTIQPNAYRWHRKTVTTTYTVTLNDCLLSIDATAGSFTVTLPALSGWVQDQIVYLRRLDGTSSVVTMARSSTDTLDGATSRTLSPQFRTYGLLGDVANGVWRLVHNSAGPGLGGGTVTSVGVSAPTNEVAVANSPVTSTGTIALTWKTQAPNTVFGGPASGSAATPTFRALVTADLPAGAIAVVSTSTPLGSDFGGLTGGFQDVLTLAGLAAGGSYLCWAQVTAFLTATSFSPAFPVVIVARLYDSTNSVVVGEPVCVASLPIGGTVYQSATIRAPYVPTLASTLKLQAGILVGYNAPTMSASILASSPGGTILGYEKIG